MVAADTSATDALRRGKLLPQYAATVAGKLISQNHFTAFVPSKH